MSGPIVLYDGVCGLCNRLVRFILRHDRNAVFRFASLQSPLAARALARHGANPADLDTFFVIVNPDEPSEFLVARSDAVLFVLQRLSGSPGVIAAVLKIFPPAIRDWLYLVVARHRYQIFGRYDSCPLPSAETRARFLDV